MTGIDELTQALENLPNAAGPIQNTFSQRQQAQVAAFGRCYAYCGGCYMPLEPAPKGNGKPGFVGFLKCCEARTLYNTTK